MIIRICCHALKALAEGNWLLLPVYLVTKTANQRMRTVILRGLWRKIYCIRASYTIQITECTRDVLGLSLSGLDVVPREED